MSNELRNLPITETELKNMQDLVSALQVEIKGMKEAAIEVDKNMEIREEFYFNMKAKLRDGLLQLREEVVAMDEKQKESDKRIEELEKENAKLTRQNEGMKNYMKKLQGNKKDKKQKDKKIKEEQPELIIRDVVEKDDKLEKIAQLEEKVDELRQMNEVLYEENTDLREQNDTHKENYQTIKDKLLDMRPKLVQMEKELEGKSDSGKYIFNNCTVTFN